MIYAIPVLGWVLGLAFAICISIPFYIIWNWLAPVYIYWLPEVFHNIPFFHCVGLFMLCAMLRFAIYPRWSVSTGGSK